MTPPRIELTDVGKAFAGVWVLVIMIHVKVVKIDTQSGTEQSVTTTQ